jgi:pimeloyl-ACP methyl ester carboxylesterase
VPDTIAFVERFIGQPTVLLGFSLGALVTLGVAARLPKLIRAIVLLEPGLMLRNSSVQSIAAYEWLSWVNETLASTRTIEEVVARCKTHLSEDDEAEARRTARMVHSLDPESVAYLLNDRIFERFDLEQVLPQVACPTLLIRGEPELGGVVRDSDVTLLKAHVPHSTTIQIMDVGHGIIWDQPGKKTLEHVTQFLNSV